MGTHQNLKALSGIDICISLSYSGGKKKKKTRENDITCQSPNNKYLS